MLEEVIGGYMRIIWMLLLCVLCSNALCHEKDAVTDADIMHLGKTHGVNVQVLRDYVQSYNFKCPQELTEYKLESLLLSFDDYTELSIMNESHEKQWREIYIEARAGITCFSQGVMSKAY